MNPNSRKGIVLLIVLGILGLMSILAISFVQISQLERAISRNYVDQTRAALVAESGVEYSLSRIAKLQGGAMRPGEIEAMRFETDPTQAGLENAIKASYQLPNTTSAVSGYVSNTYTQDGDSFILRVQDLSGKLNINDSDGQWNIDDDPYLDDPNFDTDLLDATNRLTAMVESLASALFNDATLGGLVAVAVFDARGLLQGDRFSNMGQVRDALVPLILSQDQFALLADNLTLHSWQDPNTLKPTFQLHIGHPANEPQPSDQFNIYRYADFQTQYFEKEPRSPINVNTASVELISALIRPIQGWFLYEGAPASLMDGMVAPWMKAMRATSNAWTDTTMGNGYPGVAAISPWPMNTFTDSRNWTLGNATRYGQARLTSEFTPDIADEFAGRLFARIHDPVQTRPFTTWDEFTRFVYDQVDLNALVNRSVVTWDGNYMTPNSSVQPFEQNLTGAGEAERFPYRVDEGSSYLSTPDPVIGFDRYMADALLANFNPNAMLNDFNPDMHMFRHVDKAQLTQYTTEFSFQPTGTFSIESLGLIRDGKGIIQARTSIAADVQVFHLLRLTTQQQFMQSEDLASSYDINNPDSIYKLFAEYDGGIFPAAGADIAMANYSSNTYASGGGNFTGASRLGPSLCSYPEPIRMGNNYGLNQHPYLNTDSFFSNYTGSLTLNTLQRDAGSYPTDRGLFDDPVPSPSAELPRFLAPMGYRDLGGIASDWPRYSLGAGGLLPVRFGLNDENDPDAAGSIRSDELATMNVPGGRGIMNTWGNDYSSHGSFIVPVLDTSWIHTDPWVDYSHWNTNSIRWTDHSWDVLVPYGTMFPPFEMNMPGFSNSKLYRIAWNAPTDMPLTPDARDGIDNRVDLEPGVLYPDGAFSETGRVLQYPATNMGSRNGGEGSVSFWIKPHWDTGYSNRIRQLFSVGLLGPFGNHALDLLYFPAGRRPGMVGPPDETTVEVGLSISNMPLCPKWPFPTHSMMFGSLHNNWGQWAGVAPIPFIEDYESITVSPTATDFFPKRIPGQRAANSRQLGFYGHCWNLIGLSYSNPMKPSRILTINDPPPLWEYSINGVDVTDLYKGNFLAYNNQTWGSFTDQMHWYWEEGPMYNHAWGITPMPKYMHIGHSYMRFGGCEDNGGPTGDATYDEIATWAHPVQLAKFRSGWQEGRYVNEPLVDPDTGDWVDEIFTGVPDHIVNGLYTSPKINPVKALNSKLTLHGLQTMTLHSVTWSLFWPRYNWRPGNGNNTGALDDYQTWGSRVTDLQGIDLQDGLAAGTSPDADPVTGDWDPVSVDIFDSRNGGRWIFSGASSMSDDPSLFKGLSNMPTSAGGTALRELVLRYDEINNLQYRVYFHLKAGQTILEAPVLEDITFCFTADKPIILRWEVLNS